MVYHGHAQPPLVSPTLSQLSSTHTSESTSSSLGSHHGSSTSATLPSPSDSWGPATPANALTQIESLKRLQPYDQDAHPTTSSSGSSEAPASAAQTVVGHRRSSFALSDTANEPTDVEMMDIDHLPPLEPAALMRMPPPLPFQSLLRQPVDIHGDSGALTTTRSIDSDPQHAMGLINSAHHSLHSSPVTTALSPATAASAPAGRPTNANTSSPIGIGMNRIATATVAASPDESEPDLIPTRDGRSEVIPSEGPLVGPPVETLRALASGHDARAVAVRAKYGRDKRQSMVQGREVSGRYLQLPAEEKSNLFASIGKAKKRTLSDTNKLPLSTGRRGIPRPIPTLSELQSLQEEVRRRDQSRQFGSINDEVESDSGDRRPSLLPAKGKMLRAIPCLFVGNIQLALPFYREILGFVSVSKPENHMAMLCRTPAGKSILRAGEEGVQLLLRTSFGSYGGTAGTYTTTKEYPRPPPTALWIEVESVDTLFDEVYAKCRKTDPVEDSYFPTMPFGDARMFGRPQNTPFGTREIRIQDPDSNMLIFFQELRPEPPVPGETIPTDTKVRGPVFRPRPRGRGRR